MGISFAMVAHNYYDSSRVSRCSSSPREGQPEFTWPTPERGSKSAAAKENLQSTRQKAKLSRSLLWISSPVFGLLRARYLEQCPLALSFSFISFFDSVSFFFFFNVKYQWIIHLNYTIIHCHFVHNEWIDIIFIGIKIEKAKWFQMYISKLSDPKKYSKRF